MLPKIAEVGRLWKDPEIRWTSSGKAVCEVPLVFAKRKQDEDGKWQDVGTLFLKGSVWGDQAEHTANSLSKGDQVLVSGELSQREYEDRDGNKRSSLELRIYDLGPVIKWAPVKILRSERGSTEAPADDPWSSAPATTSDDSDEPPF